MDTLEKKSVLERIDCATEQIENVVMSLGLLTISGIVFANVIARYFFQTAFAWSEELARYVVVWVTFFGISSCARYHTHVGVDLLSNFLKGRAKLVYQALICLISVGLSVYMTYISIGFTIMQYKRRQYQYCHCNSNLADLSVHEYWIWPDVVCIPA